MLVARTSRLALRAQNCLKSVVEAKYQVKFAHTTSARFQVRKPSSNRSRHAIAMTVVQASAVSAPAVVEKFRKDYEQVPFTAEQVHLTFKLDEEVTEVTSRVTMRALNPGAGKSVYLNGRDDLVLKSVSIDGKALGEGDYELDGAGLTLAPAAIPAGAESFELSVVTDIKP